VFYEFLNNDTDKQIYETLANILGLTEEEKTEDIRKAKELISKKLYRKDQQ